MKQIDVMKQALEALEEINKLSIGEGAICLPAEIDDAMDALRQAIEQAEKQEPVAWRAPNWGHSADEWVYRDADDPVLGLDGKPTPNNEPLYTTPQPQQAEKREPVSWVDLLKEASQIVRDKVVWKRFIDGTPLANDIACWMADFAIQHAPQPQREWVGLTDEEMHACWDSPLTPLGMKHVRMIEAKLKQKNGYAVDKNT